MCGPRCRCANLPFSLQLQLALAIDHVLCCNCYSAVPRACEEARKITKMVRNGAISTRSKPQDIYMYVISPGLLLTYCTLTAPAMMWWRISSTASASATALKTISSTLGSLIMQLVVRSAVDTSTGRHKL